MELFIRIRKLFTKCLNIPDAMQFRLDTCFISHPDMFAPILLSWRFCQVDSKSAVVSIRVCLW